jgi:hypothetical protein
MSGSALTSDPVAHGVLADVKEGFIVLSVPGTDYRVHLQVAAPLAAKIGDHISGTIYGSAKRIDIVPTGGRFIDPVYGRPRRLQGRITALDPVKNTISVYAGLPFHCTIMAPQKTSGFELGQMVSFDIERGARFEVADHAHH